MADPAFLPPAPGETDEERRLREAINRHAAGLMSAIDGAIRLRTAPNEAQRTRHRARGHLEDFALAAMHAHRLAHGD